MTISTSYSPDTYAGDGATTTFAVTFEFLSVGSNVKVSIKNDTTGIITTKTSGNHYNISGSNAIFTAGNIPASGETVILELNPDFTQDSDYTENSNFPAETLESDLDERCLEAQINKDQITRAFRVDSSEDISSATLAVSFPTSGTELLTLTSAGVLGTTTAASLGALTIPLTVDNGGTGATTAAGALSALGGIGADSTNTLTNKTIDADGTGNVITNIGSSEIKSELLSGQAEATLVAGDYLLFGDTSDSNNLKKDTVQGILDLVPSSSGVSTDVNQAAHGFSVGDVIRLSGASTYTKAQADSETNAEVVGLVSAVADTDNFTVLTGGQITGLTGLTANTVYFLDASTAGAITSTEPSTTGEISKPVLVTDSTTSGYILQYRGVEVGAGSSGATFTEHGVQATTSGTSITFSSIPAGTKMIYIVGSGISSDSTGAYRLRLGDSGGVEATGYVNNVSTDGGTSNQATTEFRITTTVGNVAAVSINIIGRLIAVDQANNDWVFEAGFSLTNSTYTGESIGRKTLSGELTDVELSLSSGNFDAGEINLYYA